jgi:hypothetical protein
VAVQEKSDISLIGTVVQDKKGIVLSRWLILLAAFLRVPSG